MKRADYKKIEVENKKEKSTGLMAGSCSSSVNQPIATEITEPCPKDHQNTHNSQQEIGGPAGLEPTRYGDWERNGRCVDF